MMHAYEFHKMNSFIGILHGRMMEGLLGAPDSPFLSALTILYSTKTFLMRLLYYRTVSEATLGEIQVSTDIPMS